jgi:hypothetical protein
MALPGDKNCQSVFIRSWMIDPQYFSEYRIAFLEDTQKVLLEMQTDFPNLCDLHTLIIHPLYEKQAQALGFHKTSSDSQSSVYWVYLALDRYLALDIKETLGKR